MKYYSLFEYSFTMTVNETTKDTAIFGGGCFWCTEAIFQNLKGVHKVTSGYTGGKMENPSYEAVCSGRTGHAEAVSIEFDPGVISYHVLLEVFFATHDPTTLNRQGNDTGEQYRSVIFYSSEQQKQEAALFIDKLSASGEYDKAIVTEIKPLEQFYSAEENHQNYYQENSSQPYCQVVISPKLEKLKKKYVHFLKQ